MKNIIVKGFEHLKYESAIKDSIVTLSVYEGTPKRGDRLSWRISENSFNELKKKKGKEYIIDIKKALKMDKTNEQKRQGLYKTLITRDMIDAYITYTIEGNIEKATEIAEKIKAIKNKVRENFPEE